MYIDAVFVKTLFLILQNHDIVLFFKNLVQLKSEEL